MQRKYIIGLLSLVILVSSFTLAFGEKINRNSTQNAKSTVTIEYLDSKTKMPVYHTYIGEFLYGEKYSINSPEIDFYGNPSLKKVEGYFKGKELKIQVFYNINTFSNYTINHWKETTDGDDYDIAFTEQGIGKVGSKVTAIPQIFPGFEIISTDLEFNLTADGNIVRNLYYKDSTQSIWFITRSNTSQIDPISAFADEDITIKKGMVIANPPTKEGYTFDGWDKTIPDNMPAEGLTLEAKWIPATTNYYVAHMFESRDTVGEYNLLKKLDTKSGITGELAAYTPITDNYFIFESAETEIIKGEGTTVVNVYYKRNPITVNFIINGKIYASRTGRHNTFFVPPTITECMNFYATETGIKTAKFTTWQRNGTPNAVYPNKFFDDLTVAELTNRTITYYLVPTTSTVYEYQYDQWKMDTSGNYSTKNEIRVALPAGSLTTNFSNSTGFTIVQKAETPKGTDPVEPNYTTFSARSYSTLPTILYSIRYERSKANLTLMSEGTKWKDVPYYFEEEVQVGGIIPPKPLKFNDEDYKFAGWYLDANFRSAKIERVEMSIAGTILYAKWELPEYDVSFETKTSKKIATQHVVKNEISIIPKEEIMREGYKFDGWYLGAIKYNFDMPVKNNITLVAKWVADKTSYTVKHISENGKTIYQENTYHNLLLGTVASAYALPATSSVFGAAPLYTAERSKSITLVGDSKENIIEIRYFEPLYSIYYTENHFRVNNGKETLLDTFSKSTKKRRIIAYANKYDGLEADKALKVLYTSREGENIVNFYYLKEVKSSVKTGDGFNIYFWIIVLAVTSIWIVIFRKRLKNK
ncbi:MAG: InlB B-repeat-containing protein [Anaerovoracaceae bacterium]